ncbi:hypothetical protein GCM10009113_23090 [Marinobacter szutsaonensis]
MHNNKWPATLVWALAGTLLISGCGGSDDSPAASSGQEPAAAPENSAVAPDTDTFAKTATIDRYNVANGCYTLEAGGHYLLADPQSGRYSVTPDSDQATGFRLRPTRLGAYLLMSDYQRTAGEVGSFELLGISDPAGEFLDGTGTFIGEISYLVAGLGDTTNLILDPVAPPGGCPACHWRKPRVHR